MQILSALGDKTEYTWSQSLRFFIVVALWSIVNALPPVAWAVWHNYQNYTDPVDWPLIKGMALAAVGPALTAYWLSHRNLLKMPPWLIIPPEFQPTVTVERSEHTTLTTSPDGTVKQQSPHTSVTTITPPETPK